MGSWGAWTENGGAWTLLGWCFASAWTGPGRDCATPNPGLSRIAVSSCVEGHVDVSFAFSAHRFVELLVPFSLRAPIIHA